MQTLRVSTTPISADYQIHIGAGLLTSLGHLARSFTERKFQRVAVVSNQKVFGLYGASAVASLKAIGFAVATWLMADGERFKTLRSAEKALLFFNQQKMDRGDAVVALGGGVVGDVAGFAAATYLRGIRYIQVPTTLLAQIDSSIGGKTGVNLSAGKNLVGAFHQPSGVVIDPDVLKTLPKRELTAGWCEALKQGIVGSQTLFEQTTSYLEASQTNQVALAGKLEQLIAAHCSFKASVVKADERETASSKSSGSRRILNFGHTIGHALETATRYRRFRHGEAVGHGISVAAELSKNMGLLSVSELELIRAGLRLCGPLPPAKDLSHAEVLQLIRSDKKRLRGKIQWVLIKGIGKPTIVDDDQIPRSILKQSLHNALSQT